MANRYDRFRNMHPAPGFSPKINQMPQFATELVLLKQKALELGLARTAAGLDQVCMTTGFELAAVIESIVSKEKS